MRLAHAQGKKPLEFAQELARAIAAKAPAGFFEKVEAVAPGFINIWLSASALQKEFVAVARDKTFGKSDFGGGKKVIVEYSLPNIAKALNLGHFERRSLVAHSRIFLMRSDIRPSGGIISAIGDAIRQSGCRL